MPAPKKLLPRPCPQCGLENGGMQFVIFNPRYSNSRDYNHLNIPYCILRISHYSKSLYSSSSKKKKRELHHFRIFLPNIISTDIKTGISKHIPINEVFDDADYYDKQSITIPVNNNWFESIKKHGWPYIQNEKAHFIKKGNLKKCHKFLCDNYVKELHEIKYPDHSHSLVCDECYPKEMIRIKQWEQNPDVIKQDIPTLCFYEDNGKIKLSYE